MILSVLPGKLKYKAGSDATLPHGGAHRLILQFSDINGTFDDSFGLALSKRWSLVQQKYRLWYRSCEKFRLGEIIVVPVQTDISVVLMLTKNDSFDMSACESCLNKVFTLAMENSSSINCFADPTLPMTELEKLFISLFVKQGINVNIYSKFGS